MLKCAKEVASQDGSGPLFSAGAMKEAADLRDFAYDIVTLAYAVNKVAEIV